MINPLDAGAGVDAMQLPEAYQPQYAQARRLNPDLADRYMAYTQCGDPEADAVIAALAACEQREVHRFIYAGMEQDAATLAASPPELREFFARQDNSRPAWFDPAAARPGREAFHRYSDLFIPAFFVVTLQNAATLISKAFYTTGRVTTDHGGRRIRQNTRHFVEIMLPGALEREGEGWKLSVRIRLVHAQVRRLIRSAGDWEERVYGAPLSAAHLALSAANFSATMLYQADRLGAHLNAAERAGFMQTWRYASWLIGVPEDLLFAGDEKQTNELHRVGTACEPPPGPESAVIANALVQAVPVIAGIDDPAQRESSCQHVYRVSRALLGNDLSDRLNFPRQATAGVLPWLQWKRRAYRIYHRLLPERAQKWRGDSFAFLLSAAALDDLSYRLPDHVDAQRATPW